MPTKRNHALIYRQVPAFLRQMREKSGHTLRDLAKTTGIPLWVLHRSETGSRRVDIAEFIEICNGCGVDPAAATRQLAQLWRQRSRP